MDIRYYIVRHLYGETDDAPDLHALLEDEALREEYQALSEVKFHLDHRRPSRPAPEVFDRIMSTAASRAATPTPANRSPLRLLRFGAMSAMAAMFALLLAVGLVWRPGFLDNEPSDASQSAQQEAVSPLAESDTDGSAQVMAEAPSPASPPTAEEGPAARAARASAPQEQEEAAAPETVVTEQAPAAGLAGLGKAAKVLPAPQDESADAALADEVAGGEGAIPEWDEADALFRLHRRLEMLEARSGSLAWDDSSVISLDVLPTGNPGAPRGLNAVSSPKRNQ